MCILLCILVNLPITFRPHDHTSLLDSFPTQFLAYIVFCFTLFLCFSQSLHSLSLLNSLHSCALFSAFFFCSLYILSPGGLIFAQSFTSTDGKSFSNLFFSEISPMYSINYEYFYFIFITIAF